ncbi:hypothetical protein M404DRAFT_35531 [Pisolithus tinctorius Marx 270]|uniref:Uncharacterized protein n=1 Tax=Pisolithus tinctorius Marx 270 TaxID=870435 RepID=A0A0C3NEN1_PISTI|nr:hypothetical protein M404DRAFT_35531 [Pisolithus tinctorius Marx 270]
MSLPMGTTQELLKAGGILGVHTRYIPSGENPADCPSMGEYNSYALLLPPIPLPLKLKHVIFNFNTPLSPCHIHDSQTWTQSSPDP